MNLLEQIEQALQTALHANRLDESIMAAMLPPLTTALEPILTRYLAQEEGVFPDQDLFCTMVNNFNLDGPMVTHLVARDTPQAVAFWQQLEQQLTRKTGQKWSSIGSHYQDEIVSRTMRRIERYLPKFLFQARFSTWVHTIWTREYLRLKDKIEAEQSNEISLEQELAGGGSIGDTLMAQEADPADVAARRQAEEALQARIKALGQSLDVTILRLHLAGYKLEEIKQTLQAGGQQAPSIATIKRRKDRLVARLKEDDEIRQLALELGIVDE